ncbi:MAG: hypothetical protein ABIK89_22475, partial [Planctomycetota bacterium]
MAYPHRLRNLQSWQRFTLLDMLLIQAAFGIGFSLACSLEPAEVAAVERITAGTVWGFVFAGPIVLMVQWTLRARSRGLSLGEWLWLSPALLFFFLWCSLELPAKLYPGLSPYLFLLWMFAQVTAIGIALATLFSGLRGYRSTV